MGIPIGIQDYRKLRGENNFTVDKSLMIKEFLERRSEVTLVTRPHRFHRNSADTYGAQQEACW